WKAPPPSQKPPPPPRASARYPCSLALRIHALSDERLKRRRAWATTLSVPQRSEGVSHMRQSNATKLFLLCSTISALAAVQPGAARALLGRIEANFGAVRIVSTCRPGAVIAGTRHPSMHRYGMAIDFVAPSGRKGEIVSWLARNNSGGTMTYPSMNHIHADVGP